MKRVCIVGYGSIGKTHAGILDGIEDVKLYAVCDIDAGRAKECACKYGLVKYNDYDEMIKDRFIDVVHICTPHYLHYEMMEKALKEGKQIVCEKPLTMTEEELAKLMSLENSDRICVVFQNRYNDCIVKMKEMVESGELGKVRMARGIVTWFRDMDYYNKDEWRGKWDTEGGGVLINQSIHTFDYFSYIVGKIKSVKSKMANFSLDGIEVEDSVMARLEFESGIPGVFFATNAYGRNDSPLFEVVMEKGILRYIDKKLYLNGEKIEEDKKGFSGKDYWGSGHEKTFRKYYHEGKFFSPEDVRNTMEMVFEMYKSYRG